MDSGGWSTWSWESGGPFDYNKWATLEPGDTYGCTRIGATNDYWAEDDCEAQLGCICDRPQDTDGGKSYISKQSIRLI